MEIITQPRGSQTGSDILEPILRSDLQRYNSSVVITTPAL
jgi:hypothetical protein